MSIKKYWPSEQNVRSCIHSEAEVLSDALLLSVHTPMRLQSVNYNNKKVTEKTEQDLLNYVVSNNGPFPVIGESGSGKSHIVRWLHAKLKQHRYDIDHKWHIVRIPKNATMVKVLTLLLEGLKGDEFDKTRRDIASVGSDLSPELIKRLFFTYLEDACRHISQAAKVEAKNHKKQGDERGFKQFKEKSTVAKHLGVCFSDPKFQELFIGEGKPITNTIDRLSQTKSYEEINDAIYDVKISHINLAKDNTFDLDDFNISTRSSFESLRFFTASDFETNDRAHTAVKLINQAINDTGKLVFQHIFKFNSSSFPDLFVSVRKALKSQGQTLVILIEDLAAISAVDNVLLDSLVQEDTYAGENGLCDLKSVIATTSGQVTFNARRDTIHSRAGDEQLEWRIPTGHEQKAHGDETDVLVDFCARYLNAARLGIEKIESHFIDGGNEVPIWGNIEELQESDAKALLDFGASSNGTPLFPFNRTAIINLAKLKVYREGSRNFNPRVVIKELLIPILRDNYLDFINNDYPASNFVSKFESKVPDSIRNWSEEHYYSDTILRNRLNNFLTIYASTLGVRQSFEEIQESISASQAEKFNLPSEKFGVNAVAKARCEGCSEIVEQCVCSKEKEKEKEKPETEKCSGCGKAPANCICDETSTLESEIDDWFNGQSRLSAPTSNSIRKHLFDALLYSANLSHYGVNSSSKWGGNKSLFEVTLRSSKRFNIYIPNSISSIDLNVVSLCRDEQINDSDTGFKLKKKILAIVRYDYHKQKGVHWAYPKGFEDYAHYMAFMSDWIPRATENCIAQVRSVTPELLAKQKSLMLALGIIEPPKTLLNLFVKRSEHIADKLPAPINSDFDLLQQELLKEWDENREAWLMRIAYSPAVGGAVAIDATLFQRYLTESKNHHVEPFSSAQRRMYNQAKAEVTKDLETLTHALAEISNSEDARVQLDMLDVAYTNIPTHMIPESTTTRKAKNRLKKLVDIYEWTLIENARKFTTSKDDSQQLQALYKIDGEQLKQWIAVLEEFELIESHALSKLKLVNEDLGGERMNEYRDNIECYLHGIESAIHELNLREETSNDL